MIADVDRVRAAANSWADDLIDLTGRNTLLYASNAGPVLDLRDAAPSAVSSLLSGRKVRLVALFGDPRRRDKEYECARLLRRRMLQFEEEQGVQGGNVARGLVHVALNSMLRAVAPLQAPLLLQPIAITVRSSSDPDYTLQLNDEPAVNLVLVYALRHLFGVDTDALPDKITALLRETVNPAEQLSGAYEMLAEAVRAAGHDIRLENALNVGIYSHDKLPMVTELRNSIDLLAGHPVIAALADENAADDLLSSTPADSGRSSDTVTPAEEFLVCDADNSQQIAISRALAGRHVLIEGPPGTGKTQTIANIIASMAARGRKVLFVAEKRAAIDAVTDRLKSVGLGHLVFDLHDNRIKRRHVADQIAKNLTLAQSESAPELGGLHRSLESARGNLLAYHQEAHERRQPWGMSFHQAFGQIYEYAGGPELGLDPALLRDLAASTFDELMSALCEYIDADGPEAFAADSLWRNSTVRSGDEAREIAEHVRRLMAGDVLTATNRLADEAGLRRPETFGEWRILVDLLRDVSRTLSALGPDAFDLDLTDLQWATEPGLPTRVWRHPRLLWSAYRLGRKTGLGRRRLHGALSLAGAQLALWHELAVDLSVPKEVSGRIQATEIYDAMSDDLTVVAQHADLGHIQSHTPFDLAALLRPLADQRHTLLRLPELKAIVDRFEARGLQAVLRQAAVMDIDLLVRALRHAWLSAVVEEMFARSNYLRTFRGAAHQRQVERFQRADRDHLAKASERVRHEVARRLREVADTYRGQHRVVRDEVGKKRGHKSLRQLMEKAPDVLFAAFPCWAMSPIVVTRMLPAARLFDTVIFDEASQVLPHDAIPSIMRGDQLIVAGDENQLAPSRWFERATWSDDEESDDDADLTVYESILTRLRSLMPEGRSRLKWHYRSEDQRLITFSNTEIYDGELVTFPGAVGGQSPIELVTVKGEARPNQHGSADEEVHEVVRLVLQHVRARPDESLGVIALGKYHADRVQKALDAEMAGLSPEERDFFSENRGPNRRFFVKNLENVQGDERQAIILTVGYAPANGKLGMRFGVLSQPDGHRRLNVAITRASRRMTVVSAFSPYDISPERAQAARHRGIELFRKFMVFVYEDAKVDMTCGPRPEPNGFEREVLQAMRGAGLSAYHQWGVTGYRLDFAVAHPDQPGRMVLAVETDGERYHRMASVRDRDRLRQEHLERLGWRFHRIWSAEWRRDQAGALEALLNAYRRAVRDCDRPPRQTMPPDEPRRNRPRDRGPRPPIEPGRPIGAYTDVELVALCQWILGDGLPVTRDHRLQEAIRELGFGRLGSVISKRLEAAFDTAQKSIDEMGTS